MYSSIAEKKLVAWDGGQNAGEEIELKGDAGEWCQFADKANKNVTSTFDMDQYTSKLDISKSKYSEAEAERIAREIESEQRERPIHILDDSGVRSKTGNKTHDFGSRKSMNNQNSFEILLLSRSQCLGQMP